MAVSVATVWRSPQSPRPVDAPALENPARIREWLASMTIADRAGLEGRADTQVLLGERILVTAVQSGWAQVVVPEQPTLLDVRGYPGWVPLRQLTTEAPPAAAVDATVISPTAWLDGPNGGHVLEVSFDTQLPALSEQDGVVVVGLPGGRELRVSAAAVSVKPQGQAALPPTAASVVATAKAFTGLPYLWAGTSGFGFDCSGFVYSVYRAHGITIPRDADAQASSGVPVARSALQPGDLVFFATSGYIHHVAMYIGNGLILQAPHAGAGISTASLSSEPYNSEFAVARREIGG